MSDLNKQPKTRREKLRDLEIRVLCVFCKKHPVGSMEDRFDEWCGQCTPSISYEDYVTRLISREGDIDDSLGKGILQEGGIESGLIEHHDFKPAAYTREEYERLPTTPQTFGDWREPGFLNSGKIIGADAPISRRPWPNNDDLKREKIYGGAGQAAA